MRSATWTLSRLAGLCLAASGCDGFGASEPPPFPEGQGQLPATGAAYPSGPYGIEKGAIISNFTFLGFPNPSQDQSEVLAIELADFYNPSGEELYPEDSIFGAGEPKPTVLLINVSAVWCQPCQYESDVILPAEYALYHPDGAQFLLMLAEGPNFGVAAEVNHLVSWTKKYELPWPSVIDPTSKLSTLFPSEARPTNILIDTKTMEIAEIVTGVPEEGGAFFATLEGLLEQ